MPRETAEVTAKDGEFNAMAFRRALGCFATGVTLVTTIDRQKQPIAVTVNSFNSVSLEPPLVLFSLARIAQRFDDFLEAGRFAVNVLATSQQELSSRFATPGEAMLNGVDYTNGSTGCPLLTGALASFDCLTTAIHDGGDHAIFVGEVQTIAERDGGAPLLYFKGQYGAVANPDKLD